MKLPMHPSFSGNADEWDKWRLTYKGGPQFISRYLEKYDVREDDDDFKTRMRLSYNPPDARAAIQEVRNNMFQHMAYVTREGGPISYQKACVGETGGVDRTGRDMRNFIGQEVLEEMILMRKVGVYVDAPAELPSTIAGMRPMDRPYVSMYEAEKILNWSCDPMNPSVFTSLLLTDFKISYSDDFYLPIDTRKQMYRYFQVVETENGPKVRYCVCTSITDDSPPIEDRLLDIPEIPFVVFEISQSLMVDICDHQIALLNLESSDVNWCFRANFPVWAEPYDPRFQSQFVGSDEEHEVGRDTGIMYPGHLRAPSFVSPPSEPLKASMAKQEQIKANIRIALNLALSNLAPPGQASAPAKQMDQSGLAAGLAYIGMSLKAGEQRIAQLWSNYERGSKPARIDYPITYQTKTDAQRLDEVKVLEELSSALPSLTWAKEVNKKIALTMFSGRIGSDKMKKMLDEIEKSKLQNLDRKTLQQDQEMGLVTKKFLSEGCLYPEGEAEMACEERIEDMAAIAAAQTRGQGPHAGAAIVAGGLENPAARGLPVGSVTPKTDASDEKAESTGIRDTPSDATRGPAK